MCQCLLCIGTYPLINCISVQLKQRLHCIHQVALMTKTQDHKYMDYMLYCFIVQSFIEALWRFGWCVYSSAVPRKGKLETNCMGRLKGRKKSILNVEVITILMEDKRCISGIWSRWSGSHKPSLEALSLSRVDYKRLCPLVECFLSGRLWAYIVLSHLDFAFWLANTAIFPPTRVNKNKMGSLTDINPSRSEVELGKPQYP